MIRLLTSPPRWLLALVTTAAIVAPTAAAPAAAAAKPLRFAVESLNGAGNNTRHPHWGQAGQNYRRITSPHYADGVGAMVSGPSPRYVSNRVFNSQRVDVFSPRYVSQWAWVWGQFLDHTFGFAKTGTESAPIPFDAGDPLEAYRDDAGTIDFSRDAVAAGTGIDSQDPRQQVNTMSSYINGAAIYGETPARLRWLRHGAGLLLPHGYLPRATARGDWRTAPSMQTEGLLQGAPQDAAVGGDVRANDNAELLAAQTLLAREHNRIVARLPRTLPAQLRFEIARRVVIAEQQYITYTQFLPALGVHLPRYRGYDPHTNPELSDEFATVGYRAHSMVNGEEHMLVAARRYSRKRLATLDRLGVGVLHAGPSVALTLSQETAFFNPDVVPAIGLGPILTGLAEEPGYRNDTQIDDSLRSVLFEYPGPGVSDPSQCFTQPNASGCFTGVTDLGAIDLERERDHGMPTYNQLRRALGLKPQTSFTQVTGERTSALPPGLTINSPQILNVTSLRDVGGHPMALDSPGRPTYETLRSTLAARLKAIYGEVGKLDAFVGMLSEPHVHGSEFGAVQLALWRRQFTALRDGDRFFYARDPVLREIQRRYGISYRHSLGQLISLDAGVPRRSLPKDVFFAPRPRG